MQHENLNLIPDPRSGSSKALSKIEQDIEQAYLDPELAAELEACAANYPLGRCTCPYCSQQHEGSERMIQHRPVREGPRIISRDEVLRRLNERFGIQCTTDGGILFIDGKVLLTRRFRMNTLGTDLETVAQKLHLIRPEDVVPKQRCSRCKTRECLVQYAGTYAKQCLRCYTWSWETRRDPSRCIDCRRVKDPDDPDGRSLHSRDMLSRCSRCHKTKLAREAVKREFNSPVMTPEELAELAEFRRGYS